MFQTHYQVIRPVTTAHLAQTMTLLSLNAEELRQHIDSELAANPALELIDERRCPTCHRILPEKGNCPLCSAARSNLPEEPVVFISPREDFYSHGTVSAEDQPEEQYSPCVEDLPTYVLRQIAPELELRDRQLAAYLLTHLDQSCAGSYPARRPGWRWFSLTSRSVDGPAGSAQRIQARP